MEKKVLRTLSSLLASFVLASAIHCSALAQTFWTDGVGDWFNPFNWSAGVPNPASGTAFDARIDNGGIAQIFAAGASVRRITLGALGGQSGGLQVLGVGSLDVTQNLHLGESGQGVVSVGSGGTITSQYTRLGRFSGGSGIATVTGAGSTWSTSLDFLAGESGSGSLSVNTGGAVIAGNNFLVANSSGAPTSNVTVADAGSTLTVQGALLRVGNAGNGTLTVSAGGAVSADATEIASASGSVSSVTITGAGSVFDAGTSFKVGVLGSGSLNLLADGVLNVGGGAGTLIVAGTAGGSGALNIGNGGAAGVLNASAVQMGNGTGVVNFNHTGTVDFAIPISGVGALSKFGTGTANLTGVSTFTRAVTVTGGTLELSGGGQINNDFDSAIASGNLLITGAGSQWTNAATTYIGDTGTGVATVEAGGFLQANTALLLSRFGSGNGTLTVTGAGSSAATSGELRIADQGTGLLEIFGGGVVTSGNGWLAKSTVAANAAAHISGVGSQWSITGFLDVGERGTGTLLVENAGQVVNTGGGYVGFIGGSNGFATVDGAGSTWDSLFFQVGGSGAALMTIRNGGTAISRLTGANSVSLGETASGNGTVRVQSGASWVNEGSMVIGTNGQGTMNIQTGGTVSAGPDASIGFNSGAVGVATVADPGSLFSVPGTLVVGGRASGGAGNGGNGTLTISNGGAVTVGVGAPSLTSGVTQIGLQNGAVGLVTVTGAGSTLTSDSYIELGQLGAGTLNIADGGFVNVGSGGSSLFVGSNLSLNPSTLRIGTGAGAGTLSALNVALVRTFSKLEFNHTDATTFAVPITGAGFVNKLGAGTTTLSGASTFTGPLNVNAGIIELRAPGDLANVLPINVAFGAEFQLYDSTTTHAQSLANSGRVKFFDSSLAGTAAITNYPTTFQAFGLGSTVFGGSSNAESATITNLGATTAFNEGAATAFQDFASAGSATIYNQPSPVNTARRSVGSTSFIGTSTAENAQIFNTASTTPSGGGGLTEFYSGSSAGNATITSRGATVAGPSTNGGVEFAGATAGTATFLNQGATVNGGKGGTVFYYAGDGGSATFRQFPSTVSGAFGGDLEVQGFFGASPSLGSAVVENLGASANGAHGGTTLFQGNSTAGASTIRNARSVGASAEGGKTTFTSTLTFISNAGSADITNEGAQNGTYGLTEFRDESSAASATVHDGASLDGSVFGGRTYFFNNATAASATFDNEGSKVTDGYAGEVFFQGASSAAAATITNRGKTVSTAYSGGIAYFLENAAAGTATIINEGSDFQPTSGNGGGWTQFQASTTAGQANISNHAATAAAGSGGATAFSGSANAASAAISNEGGVIDPGAWTNVDPAGKLSFSENASAGSATITNAAATVLNAGGGHTSFSGASTAATANINNVGGVISGNGWTPGSNSGAGYLTFADTSSAGSAIIDNHGAVVAGGGRGTTVFGGSSTAGNAAISIDFGNGAGGDVQFTATSDGGTARVILAGSGVDAGGLDISQLTSGGMNLGSIEGTGIVSLGSKYLSLGTNNLSTTFSGLIRDGGYGGGTAGGIAKVGTGTLTLSSPNTYTGATTIYAGRVRVNETTGQALSSSWTYVGPGGTLEYTENGLGGSNSVINAAAPDTNSYGGRILFRDTSSAGTLNIGQSGTTFSPVFTESETYFYDLSTAGNATFTNFGGQAGSNAHGGAVFFLDFSSAGDATFTNEGGAVAGAGGGFVTMARDSRGGTAHFINKGTSTIDSRGLQNGGTVYLGERTNAENATFTNEGGTANGGSSGGVSVSDTASAGSAIFTNLPGTVSGAPGGRASFRANSTAGSAQIENRNGTVAGALAGNTQFFDNATAGSATITSLGASGPNINPGELIFSNQSTAASATIIAGGGGMHNVFAAGTPGGLVTFGDTSRAGSATFTLEAGTQPGGAGGSVEFRGNSTAENATFNALAPTIDAGTGGGSALFYDTSTAGSASFTTEGAKNFNAYFAATGSVIFYNQSTADTATLTNLPAIATAANGGFTGFTNTATAGNATLVNRGGGLASGQGGDIGFFGSSTAGNSTIQVIGGEVAGAFGSSLRFNDTSTAGNATIFTLGAADASGGYTRFYNNSSGGSAAFVTENNGLFDISYLASTGTTAGSIAGSGNYSLGTKLLTVGSLGTNTTVSGAIYGTGGTLTKVGAGTFTIDAEQDYETLNADGGLTVLGTALGTGISTLNVNASAEIQASQTLAALNIGDGATVTLTSAAPVAPVGFFDTKNVAGQFDGSNLPALSSDLNWGWDDSQLSATGTPRVVPEPGTATLLLASLSLLSLRRRR